MYALFRTALLQVQLSMFKAGTGQYNHSLLLLASGQFVVTLLSGASTAVVQRE